MESKRGGTQGGFNNYPDLKTFYLMENQDMVSVIDQDGDGDINFNEFVWLMTRFNN